MGGFQNVAGGLAAVRAIVRSAYQQSELKSRVDAQVTELQRKARGSLAKRVLDPAVFRVSPETDIGPRVELLRLAGLSGELKRRNEHHNRRDIKKRQARVLGYPESLQIAVTTQCNLRCKMCSLTAEGKDYTGRHADPALFKRIEPILPFVSGIKLQGTGEPFLYPGMKQACELGMKHDVQLSTVTNATVIDDDMARLVAPSFREIFVSIDAASPDMYKHIRCGGKLEQVLRGIDLINKYRGPNLRLGFAFTIMRDNVHELPDFVRMAKRMNAQLVRASWLVPFTSLPWTLGQEPTEHPHLMARWFAETRAVAEELSIRVELPPLVVPVSEPEPEPALAPAPAAAPAPSPQPQASAAAEPRPQTESPAPAPKPQGKRSTAPAAAGVIANLHGRRVRGTCSLMYNNAYIHEDSTVAPCCFLKGRVGTLAKDDFRSVWNGEGMASLREEFNSGRLPDACTRCAFLRMGRIGDAELVDS
jgi:MoaA/NifB/PqqE/SkfB family radical SAM enzyme